MDKAKIKNALQKIVDQKVKAYKEDFSHDLANLAQKQNALPMLFLARECGTQLISFAGAEKWTQQKFSEYVQEAKTVLCYYLTTEPESVWLYIISRDRVQEITVNRLARACDFLEQAQLLSEIA